MNHEMRQLLQSWIDYYRQNGALPPNNSAIAIAMPNGNQMPPVFVIYNPYQVPPNMQLPMPLTGLHPQHLPGLHAQPLPGLHPQPQMLSVGPNLTQGSSSSPDREPKRVRTAPDAYSTDSRSSGPSSSGTSGSSRRRPIIITTQQFGLVWRKTLDLKVTQPLGTPRSGSWTFEEDEELRKAVAKFNARSWRRIALCVTGRDANQCMQRWRALAPDLSKGHWSASEDERLRLAVSQVQNGSGLEGSASTGINSPVSYKKVSKIMKNRTTRQCRERWNTLKKSH